jgi:uncharacterized protein (DUF58 family)
MLAAELLKQIKNLEIRASHLVTESMAGEYLSAFKGVGIEFEKVREYSPGDDTRTIDWNVTARMQSPFVKVFQEERELTINLLVDVSPSLFFGSQERFKNELAAELAAVLAFLASRNNDKVGLLLFSDHVEKYIPPKKGRAHIWQMIKEVLSHKSLGQQTRIDVGLEYLLKVCKRRSMCFLVSDFKAKNYQKSLQYTAQRHDLICIKVEDKHEQVLPGVGLLELEDSETGERILVDSSHESVRRLYENAYQEEHKQLVDFLKKQRIDFFTLGTQESVVTPLIQYMQRRERKKQHG